MSELQRYAMKVVADLKAGRNVCDPRRRKNGEFVKADEAQAEIDRWHQAAFEAEAEVARLKDALQQIAKGTWNVSGSAKLMSASDYARSKLSKGEQDE